MGMMGDLQMRSELLQSNEENQKLKARVQELETAIDDALDWIHHIENNEDSIKILKDVLGKQGEKE